MILYVDSSVLLRRALGQPGALAEPADLERALASAIIQVECMRALDRLRLQAQPSDAVVAARYHDVRIRLRQLELMAVNPAVLERAQQPLAVALGTLDALHLASALLWQEAAGRAVVLATHDRQLALAAQASGLTVLGAD